MLILGVALMAATAFLAIMFGPLRNRCWYFERIHFYMQAGDRGALRRFARTDMRLTVPPYWRGKGVQVSLGKLTFQVGLLTMRVGDLDQQLGLHVIDTETDELRAWKGRRAKEAEAKQNQ